MRDLNAVADCAFSRWERVSLFACSLGAYFSLNAYPGRPFERCLFLSPVVDMKRLVEQMMEQSGVTPERLEREGEIATPFEPLRWDYYRYILSHPVTGWPIPTRILYGALDDLQPGDIVRAFADRFGARLTVAEHSRHPFMDSGDDEIVEKWLRENV